MCFAVVMDKCLTSEECLSKLGPEAEGKELLVPLSNSVYVPGFLTGADKAIIGEMIRVIVCKLIN